MKIFYKCTDCEVFFEKKDIERISYSTDWQGNPKQHIVCKNCTDFTVKEKLK